MKQINKTERPETRRHFPLVIAIAVTGLALLVVLIFLLRGLQKESTAVVSRSEQKGALSPQAAADSLIIQTGRSFGLTESTAPDLYSGQETGEAISRNHRFIQPWMADLPVMIYAQRLSAGAAQSSLACDCVESPKDGTLYCILWSDGAALAKVSIVSDATAKLLGREVAIVLTNLASIREDDLVTVIRSGFLFSYFATLDVYPSDDVRKLLAHTGVTAILELPVTQSEWQRMMRPSTLSRSKAKQPRFGFDEFLVDEAFGRHENVAAIKLGEAGPHDAMVTNLVLDKALHERMPYVCSDSGWSATDSMALSRGLRLVRLRVDPSLRCNSVSELRIRLIAALLDDSNPRQMIITLNADNLNPRELIDLKIVLGKIGVNLRPAIKLAENVKAL